MSPDPIAPVPGRYALDTLPATHWSDQKNGAGEAKDGKNGNGTNGNENATNGKDANKNSKPPPIRTFPQALCAYARALRMRLHGIEAEPDNGKSSDAKDSSAEPAPKGSKNPGPDRAKPNGDGKDNGKSSGPTNNGSDDPSPKDGKNPDPDNEKAGGNGDKGNGKDEPNNQWFSAHGQATLVMQHHGPFNSPYQGMNSLFPISETRNSLTSTLFLDARLWEFGRYSSEVVFNPEIAGGRGFSGVNGIAGFPNGEITRVGVPEPTPYIARLYSRQTWGLGGEQEDAEDIANQIAGKRDINRFSIMVGKFAFTDFMDNNVYSHDPRTQMMNWSMMYNGAWDYPANVRGYIYGVVLEFNQKYWAVRYGISKEPAIANGAAIDPDTTRAFGQALEWEGRWWINKHPGHVRLLGYLNRANMGDYREAIQEMPVEPNVTFTRDYRYKYGFGLSGDQELTRDLGVWARLGWSDGHTESWAFTPIDRTAAAGLSLKGRLWVRPNDTLALGVVANGLAKDHRDYLAAGGLDFNLGDGRLNYAWERTFEIQYRAAVTRNMFISGDYQYIINPAYNRDRGPVSIYSLVAHIEF